MAYGQPCVSVSKILSLATLLLGRKVGVEAGRYAEAVECYLDGYLSGGDLQRDGLLAQEIKEFYRNGNWSIW